MRRRTFQTFVNLDQIDIKFESFDVLSPDVVKIQVLKLSPDVIKYLEHFLLWESEASVPGCKVSKK